MTNIEFTYTITAAAASVGPQTVTARLTRGTVPVAPEPVYIELDAQGFSLPAALHPTLDPKLTGLFYKTVWRTIGGSYASPQNLTHNDKSTIHGPRFMWVFEEPGTYIADVTVVNMYDHTEVATTTIEVSVENYLDWFTQDIDERTFWVVSLDGNTDGLPAQVASHPFGRTYYKANLERVATDMQNRSNKPVCILLKQGETHDTRANFFNANIPNIYIRTYTGNLGTARPVLTRNSPISIGGSFPTDQRSIQVSGLAYQGALNVVNETASSTSAQKFFNMGANGNHIICLHDCVARGASIPVETTASTPDSYGTVWDCDFSESVQCNFLSGFGRFTSLVGSRLMYAEDAPGTYPGLNAGWSVRHKDKSHHWMCEIGAKSGHDSSDAIQPALRLGKTTGQGGDYCYVGACTLKSNVSFGTSGSFDKTTSVNAVVEGNRIVNQSQSLNGVISTIMPGIVAYNNLSAFSSATPHLGPQFRGNEPLMWETLADLAPDNAVIDAGLSARFNTHVSLSDVTGCEDRKFILLNGSGAYDISPLDDESNVVYAPYETVPAVLDPVDLSRHAALSHTVKPYQSYDVAVEHGTGVAEDMVTIATTGTGFVAGETLTQGGVTGDIYQVQDDGAETRLWIANTTGGAFAAGPASSPSGSGALTGPAVYRGTMIDGTPDTPVAASNKTWVPTLDHYWNSRTYAAAVQGAVQTP